MQQIRHVPVAKADRPKKKSHTRKHRAANKRRLEQELGRVHQVRASKKPETET